MKRIRIKAIEVILAAAILATGSTIVSAQDDDKVVKVGLITDFTGVLAQLAKDIEDSWMLALEERGGKVGEYKVEIVRADSESSPPIGIQKANKMIKSDGVSVFGGVVDSGVAIALAGIADKEKVPFVAGFAVADVLTGKFCSPYVFRTSFSANALQSASGKYWADKGAKTAVFMAPDFAAGHAMRDGFRRGFESAGGKVLAEMLTPFGTTRDWAPSLLRAQQTGADMIYAFYPGSEAVQFVKQYTSLGLKDQMPLRGAMWIYDEALWHAMDGAQIGGMHVTTYTNALDTEASERFEAVFKKKYGRLPVASNAMGYTNAVAVLDGLAGAIEANGGVLPEDGAKIGEAIAAVDMSNDPRGPVSFNDANNAEQEELYIVRIVEGPNGPEHELVDVIAYGEDIPGCEMN